MSVLIDMDMPQSCAECFAYEREYNYCILYSQGIPNRYNCDPFKKPEWCDLKEADIPERF